MSGEIANRVRSRSSWPNRYVTTGAGYGGATATVLADCSMSVDGFVAGRDVSVDQPMGAGGERLHEWLFDDPPSPEDAAIARDARTGTADGGPRVELERTRVVASRRVTHVHLRAR